MRKLLLLFLSVIFVVGCSNRGTVQNVSEEDLKVLENMNIRINYIHTQGLSFDAMTGSQDGTFTIYNYSSRKAYGSINITSEPYYKFVVLYEENRYTLFEDENDTIDVSEKYRYDMNMDQMQKIIYLFALINANNQTERKVVFDETSSGFDDLNYNYIGVLNGNKDTKEEFYARDGIPSGELKTLTVTKIGENKVRIKAYSKTYDSEEEYYGELTDVIEVEFNYSQKRFEEEYKELTDIIDTKK